jgi:hypothetical protein
MCEKAVKRERLTALGLWLQALRIHLTTAKLGRLAMQQHIRQHHAK